MAIIQGRSYYYPGGQGTEVSGVGGGDASAYLQALMQREAADANRQRRTTRPMGAGVNLGGGGGGMRMAAPPPTHRTEQLGPSRLEQLRERDEIMQMQARQNPAPMRMVTGPGVTPGYVMDTNAMNAYQREAFLPKNSTREFSPDEIERSGVDAKAYEAWLALMNAQRQSTQNTNLADVERRRREEREDRMQLERERQARGGR